MAAAFQRNIFQNNVFQIGLSERGILLVKAWYGIAVLS